MKKRIFIVIFFLGFGVNAIFAQAYKDLRLFSTVINHVTSNYLVEKSSSELIYYAINGVLRSLDPHSIYLDPEQFSRFAMISQGKMYGIGIELYMVSDSPLVVNVVENSPADKSGIMPGDILKKINGVSIGNLTLPELKLMFYGEEGSKVLMTFHRHHTDSDYDVNVERKEIDQPSISHFFRLDNNTIYLKCTNFSLKTAEEFYDHLKKIEPDDSEKLIIDLRNNPGGELQNTINVAKYFLAKGDTISKTIGRKTGINEVYVNKKDGFFKLPVIVLVNRSSASASELLAGALQDNDRGLIIGTNTFGKGLIQSTFYLDNGGAILMTIGKYLTPSGRSIQREFKDIPFEKYYSQIYNTDSLNYKENRSVFKSKNNREIYGGGGVIPDIFIESQNLKIEDLDPGDLKLYFINFASNYLHENKGFYSRYTKFSDFDRSFYLTEEAFKKTNGLVKDMDEIIDKIEFNQSLHRLIKSNIAEMVWGPEEAFLVLLKTDNQLKKAVSLRSSQVEYYLKPH